jgi:predicted RNase H-like HicB family nuclease
MTAARIKRASNFTLQRAMGSRCSPLAAERNVRWLSLRSFSSAAEGRKIRDMNFRVEIEQEEDGRWIAEVVDLPGVLAYGSTSKEAQAKVQALALRVVADRLEHGEAGPDLVSISFAAA